ncbi:hypothetical protein [Nevskia sp.]|uniref:hypothetical protein n=1 Tax=Nevskia sp. TaxID=1929292 RepID=UPI002600C4A2|nr:hypothetical protein [Nevskia sp.]
MIPISNAYDFYAALYSKVRAAIDAASRFEPIARGTRSIWKGDVIIRVVSNFAFLAQVLAQKCADAGLR